MFSITVLLHFAVSTEINFGFAFGIVIVNTQLRLQIKVKSGIAKKFDVNFDVNSVF